MKHIATQKLYEELPLTDYFLVKKEYIEQVFSDVYASKSPQERWAILMDKFELSVQNSPQVIRSFRDKLTVFDVSTEQALNYFEQFYFLYTTEHAHYSLTNSAKNKLIWFLKDALEHCPTGITNRFEMALQECRKELDWVKAQLSLFRYQTLVQLQDRYNQEYSVSDTFSVHTLDLMVNIARELKLGIRIEHEFFDSIMYIMVLYRFSVIQYFQKHYQRVFSEYERSAITNLSQYLLFEVGEMIRNEIPQDVSWDLSDITITKDTIIFSLSEFINTHLALPSLIAAQYPLLETDFDKNKNVILSVKNKKEFLHNLQNLIEAKLIHEGYFIPLANLTEQNEEELALIKMAEGVERNDLLTVAQYLKDYDGTDPGKLQKDLIRHRTVILQYPGLLRPIINAYPNVLSMLPNELKHSSGLASVFINEHLLVESTAARYLALYDTLPPIIQQHFNRNVTDNMNDNIDKMNATHELLRNEPFLVTHIESLAQKTHPDLFFDIVRQRQTLGFAAFPYCDDIDFLHMFRQNLSTHFTVNDWNTVGYNVVKRRADDFFRTNPSDIELNRASDCMATTSTWYMAMAKYHTYSHGSVWESWWEAVKQLNIGLSIIMNLSSSIAIIAITTAILVAININAALIAIKLALLFVSACSYAIGYLFTVPSATLFSTVMLVLAFAPEIFGLSMIIPELSNFNRNFNNALLPWLTQRCLWTFFGSASIPVETTLQQKIDNSIFRLKMSNDFSANQKGNILEMLSDLVNDDIADISSTETVTDVEKEEFYSQNLNKEYSFFYQGKPHQTSFYKVAATKRNHPDEFDLGEPASNYSFFAPNRSTTTCALLGLINTM